MRENHFKPKNSKHSQRKDVVVKTIVRSLKRFYKDGFFRFLGDPAVRAQVDQVSSVVIVNEYIESELKNLQAYLEARGISKERF